MRPFNLAVMLAICAALAACGGKPDGGQIKGATQASANTAGDGQLTAEQLEAKAKADEAEANRLEALANGQAAAAGTPDQSVGGAAGAAQRTLGPANQKMGSGEYYDTLTFPGQPGHTYEVTYQAHGYTPVIVVLDPDQKEFSQSKAIGTATAITDEVKPDKAGTWYVLLTAQGVGAGGTYEVNIQETTETPIG